MLTLLSRRSLSHQGHSSLHMPRITHFIMPRYFTPGFRPHGILRIYMLFNAFITHIYATQLLITHLYANHHLAIQAFTLTSHFIMLLAAFHYAPIRISLCSDSHFVMLLFAFHYASKLNSNRFPAMPYWLYVLILEYPIVTQGWPC